MNIHLALLLSILIIAIPYEITSLSAKLAPKGFNGVKLPSIKDSLSMVDIGEICNEKGTNKLVIFGTYAADFNAIEYCQRLKHYLPELKRKGIDKYYLILNASPESCQKLCELVEFPSDDQQIQILSDPSGSLGKVFGKPPLCLNQLLINFIKII